MYLQKVCRTIWFVPRPRLHTFQADRPITDIVCIIVDTLKTSKIRLIMYLRTMGIHDTDVLSALENVPRENFVPAEFRDQCYEDTALPIGLGQTISRPYIVASMTQSLRLSDRDKVLEVGTGSGYQTSILARLCRRVYTVERHKPLLDKANDHFDKQKLRNITAMAGDGMLGWAQQAPFDRIVCTAAAMNAPPNCFFEQLRDGGIMIVPIQQEREQMLKVYHKVGEDTWSVRDLCQVRFVPLLPDIAAEKGAKRENGDPAMV